MTAFECLTRVCIIYTALSMVVFGAFCFYMWCTALLMTVG